MKWFKRNKWAEEADALAPTTEQLLKEKVAGLEVEKKELTVLANDTERMITNVMSRQQDAAIANEDDSFYSEGTRSHYEGIDERSASKPRPSMVEYQMLYGEGGDTILHACVYAIAQDVSRVLQRPIVQSTREVSPRMPSVALAKPNSEDTLPSLLNKILIDALLVGNGFLSIDSGSGELLRLDPKRMRVYPDSHGHLSHYGYVNMNNTNEQRLEKETVVHLKLFDPNQPMWGVSPTQAARSALLINDGETKYLARFYKNGARPSGFITFDKDVDIDEAKRAFDEFKSKHARQEAHGNMAALVGGAKFEPMGLTPVEGGVVETRRLTQDLFQAVFGIPAFRLMDLTDADYANSKAQIEVYDMYTVIPWAELLADAINKNPILVPNPEVLKLEPNTQPIINKHLDKTAIAAEVTALVTLGLMSRDMIAEKYYSAPPLPLDVPQWGSIDAPAPSSQEPNKERGAKVYRATSRTTGKFYIGKTTQSLEERIRGHRYEAKNRPGSSHFYRAWNKYGEEDFEWDILETCVDNEAACALEQIYISLYDTYDNGYNSTLGGENPPIHTGPRSEEWKESISDARKQLTDEEIEELRFEYAEGDISFKDLARQWGISKSSCFRYVRRISRLGGQLTVAKVTAKLTHEQAEEIRTKYETGDYTQTQLAKEYGVSQRMISRVVRQEAYKTDTNKK